MFIGGLLLLFLIAFVVLFIIFAIIKAVIKISLGLLFGFPVIGAIVIVVIVAAILCDHRRDVRRRGENQKNDRPDTDGSCGEYENALHRKEMEGIRGKR